MMSLDISTQGN